MNKTIKAYKIVKQRQLASKQKQNMQLRKQTIQASWFG